MFTHKSRKIRFGTVSPKDKIPDAVVVCLPGLGEFAEKYFETAHDCLSMNLAFWVIDWAGQGASTRLLKNPHKRHARDFEDDIDDLHALVLGYIKHSSVHPDVGRIPLVMLGHSMGGHIGLRYLARHPDLFECAAFSAPMIGIKAARFLPSWLSVGITNLICLFADTAYVPGGSDWRAAWRDNPGKNLLSSDPVRAALHNAWCRHNPALQMGSVTWGWLNAALISCARLRGEIKRDKIKTPGIMALAGNETLVSNAAIKRAVQKIPGYELIELAGAHHEILMERDEWRGQVLKSLNDMITARIRQRPETKKRF